MGRHAGRGLASRLPRDLRLVAAAVPVVGRAAECFGLVRRGSTAATLGRLMASSDKALLALEAAAALAALLEKNDGDGFRDAVSDFLGEDQ